MFTEPFMQRALLAALFLGPLCAFMGVFVTARRMAFFSDTISHSALTGVAIGFWFGLADPTWPMVFVSLLVALGMIGHYVARALDEARKRPLHVIEAATRTRPVRSVAAGSEDSRIEPAPVEVRD